MSEVFPVMKGDARVARGASYFEVPLFSHVIDNLWQGCSPSEFPDEVEELDWDSMHSSEVTRLIHEISKHPIKCKYLMKDGEPRFDAILNLYQWGVYEVPEGVEQLTVEMYDSLEAVSEQVDDLADQVIEWLDSGKKVLVHCQAGLNRSSLVVARILMKKYKMKGWEAIKLLRNQRSQICLCNETFAKHILSYDNG